MFSGLQGPLLHKNSGPVNQRDPSTSCFVVSLLDASSGGCCLCLRKTMRWDQLGPGFAALC